MNKEEIIQQRQEAYQRGLEAEQLAVDYLVRRGYDIKERRWKPSSGQGEIDIIAGLGTIIAFVEVKTRTESVEEALDSVDRKKMRAIALGADKYLRGLPLPFEYRFDIIAVDFNNNPPEIIHIEDAFLSPLFTK